MINGSEGKYYYEYYCGNVLNIKTWKQLDFLVSVQRYVLEIVYLAYI